MPPESPRFLAARGFFYPYRGLRFLASNPGLLGYVAVPAAVNTLLYAAAGWFAASRFSQWVEAVLPEGDAWYWALLHHALWVAFALAVFLVVVYTFTLVGNLVLAPFNDLLSEKVERAYAGSGGDEPFRLSSFLSDLKRSFLAELGRLAVFGTGFAVLAVATFLFPPAGAALTVYSLFALGWEYFDYSMERQQFTFAAKRSLAFGNLLTFLSFGAGTALLLLIPLLNFLAIPVCVAGATLLFCDLRAAGRVPGAAAGQPRRAVER